MTTKLTWSLIASLCLLLCCIHLTSAILCYQCAGTSSNSDCEVNYSGLINTSSNYTHNKVYLQNCTDSKPTWDRCMIERAFSNGQTLVYNRGCHDGVHFTPQFNDSMFYGLAPNNFTTCAQLTTWLVCYSFCKTDFCNGPVVPEVKNVTTCNETALEDWEICAGHRVNPSGIFSLVLTLFIAFLCHALT